MTRFEKGSNCAKDAMTKCREAKQAKRLNKKQDSPSSTIMFGGAIDEMIKNDVKEEIKNEIVLKKPKDNSKKEVKQNIQMEISKEEIKPLLSALSTYTHPHKANTPLKKLKSPNRSLDCVPEQNYNLTVRQKLLRMRGPVYGMRLCVNVCINMHILL